MFPETVTPSLPDSVVEQAGKLDAEERLELLLQYTGKSGKTKQAKAHYDISDAKAEKITKTKSKGSKKTRTASLEMSVAHTDNVWSR